MAKLMSLPDVLVPRVCVLVPLLPQSNRIFAIKPYATGRQATPIINESCQAA